MSVAQAAHAQTPPPPSVVRDAAMDWVKFDAELARDGTFDPVDKALYAALASFVPASSGQERASSPEGHDVPTRRVLAACIGRSVDTVDRATKRLEERGLIAVERRQDPENPRSNLPSVYRLLDHERWDERAAERAARRKAQREEARRKAVEAKVAAQARSDWPHGCGEGGRTDAATPGRTSAAVPLPTEKSFREKSSLSEGPGDTSEVEPAASEREMVSASQDKPSTAQRVIRKAAVLADGEDEQAFIAWATATHQPRGGAWWRTVATNGDLPDLVAAWRAERQPAAAQRPAERPMPLHCGDSDCDPVTRRRDREAGDGLFTTVPCPDCHPDNAPAPAAPTWATGRNWPNVAKPKPGGHVPFKCPTDQSVYDLDFYGRPLPGYQPSKADQRTAQAFAVAEQLRAEEDGPDAA